MEYKGMLSLYYEFDGNERNLLVAGVLAKIIKYLENEIL